jgi:hypothetical protein
MKPSEDQPTDIVISYAPDEKRVTERIVLVKFSLAVLASGIFMITIAIFLFGLLEIAIMAIPVLFFIVFPLSLVLSRIPLKNRLVIILIRFVSQVLVPPFVLVPFDHYYGMLVISSLYISLIFFGCETVFERTGKR